MAQDMLELWYATLLFKNLIWIKNIIIKINFTLQDLCSKPLKYDGCNEYLGQIICNECNLSKYGPREIGFFMTKWNHYNLNNVTSKKYEDFFLL